MSSGICRDFSSLSNEELVRLSQQGDENARSILSARFLNTRGAGVSVSYLDSDDFVQEGMLGFLRAVQTYDFSGEYPLRHTLSSVCRTVSTLPQVFQEWKFLWG